MIMKCDYCNVEMVKGAATEKEPYRYALSGLPNVSLFGITVHRCPTCGFEAPIIPRTAELHQVIAELVLKKRSNLNGEEIRFLRKHAGFPANKFALLLGIGPAHLSHVETGKRKSLGGPTDRLVRALTLTAREGNGARDMLMSIANDLDRSRRQVSKPPVFRLYRKTWKAA